MPRTRRVTALATTVLLSLVAASCGGDDDDAADAEPSNPNDEVPWGECTGNDAAYGGESAQCAKVSVPLDYEQPDGDTIEIDVLRVPATGDRIGALFVNPGGPGATATDFAGYMATALPDVAERFDIVGVNPRGLGSSAIDCGGNFEELYGVDYTIDSPEDTETLLDVSQEYVDGCEANVGDDVLANLGTRDVARDMDQVRELMGDEQLNYLGISYGTAIGQVYAEEFPDRVRAMVIDGIVEVGLPGAEAAAEQAVGFESALTAFAEWCDSGEGDCAIAPDAIGAIDELTAQIEAEPIAAEPRALGPGELNLGLANAMYVEDYWPDLAKAVADGLDGDGSNMVSLADDYLSFGSFDIYFAVNCLDSEWPSAEELLADGVAANAEAPHFGEGIVNDYVRCSMWPVESEPLGEITAPGTPPIVVVSTTNDPATPYEAGVTVAERLESGVLLTNVGEGHGIVGSGKPCIDDAVTTYLIDEQPPEDGTTCE